jgi:hypothetical protein
VKLWFPIVVPPLAALAQQSSMYALVARECAEQQRLPLHVVAAIALLVTLFGVAVAWRHWSAVGVAAPEDSGDARSHTRFLAIVGIAVSAIMALAVIAMWATSAFVAPCMR